MLSICRLGYRDDSTLSIRHARLTARPGAGSSFRSSGSTEPSRQAGTRSPGPSARRPHGGAFSQASRTSRGPSPRSPERGALPARASSASPTRSRGKGSSPSRTTRHTAGRGSCDSRRSAPGPSHESRRPRPPGRTTWEHGSAKRTSSPRPRYSRASSPSSMRPEGRQCIKPGRSSARRAAERARPRLLRNDRRTRR